MKKIVIFLLISVATTAAYAETRYITDRLEITMRSGESNQHKILRMLSSGTQLELIQTNTDSGYSQVRLKNGSQGWVITRYLEQQRSARERLAANEKQLARIKSENRVLNDKFSELTRKHSALNNKTNKLSADNEKQSKEFARVRSISSNALTLDSENTSLREQTRQLERAHQALQLENGSLKDRSDRDWFIVGSGVILLGMMIGLIIPKIRWRKKSDWSSL
ncbi:MAG: TIGR04211 family SH3 domain-containing protein [Gammaproteobacteria bacterium]|nr:TIGR04211 family SH3 domain-containing protein [Gammaproteobacteria bacterium]